MPPPAGPSGAPARKAPPDSLGALVTRIAAQVLAGEAGLPRQLAGLSQVPLSALRAYLDGQTALRQGRWSDAMQSYGRALDADSTFAQAAVGLAEAGSWDVVGDHERGVRLAMASRSRLSPGDRVLLTGLVGPHWPDLSSNAETLAAAEAAVQALPDRPEAWFKLGDLYWHWGAALGLVRPRDLAAAAFRRAIALDSSIIATSPNAEPIVHLFQIAAIEGDTATVRRLGAPVIAAESVPGFFHWRMAWVFHDSAALDSMRRRFDAMSTGTLAGIITRSVEDGLPLDDADRAAAVMVARAGTREEQVTAEMYRYLLATHEGRPGDAAAGRPARSPEMALLRAVGGECTRTAPRQPRWRPCAKHPRWPAPRCAREKPGWAVLEHLLGGTLEARARTARRPGAPWRGSEAARRQGSGLPARPGSRTSGGALCGPAGSFARHDRAAAERRRAGSPARHPARAVSPGWNVPDNLVAAHLLEANGDIPGALAAVRRRLFDLVPSFLATYLREEGRAGHSRRGHQRGDSRVPPLPHAPGTSRVDRGSPGGGGPRRPRPPPGGETALAGRARMWVPEPPSCQTARRRQIRRNAP